VDKAGYSGKPQKASVPRSVEDIPEALRDTPEAKTQPRIKLVFLLGGLFGLGVLALIASLWYFASAPQRKTISEPSPAIASSPTPKKSSAPHSSPVSHTETLLGHFAYPEASAADLQPIVADGSAKLRKAAAKQFQAMVAAAQDSDVLLVPISGFRSIAYQQQVFFDIKATRGQTATKRAEVSAPPGYSEHHTGYAVDIGDGTVPATNLSPKFDKTRAFKWLHANAARFSFEMSFPKNNPQGVSYEPWHWRFVGDRQSLETFYRSKSLTQK